MAVEKARLGRTKTEKDVVARIHRPHSGDLSQIGAQVCFLDRFYLQPPFFAFLAGVFFICRHSPLSTNMFSQYLLLRLPRFLRVSHYICSYLMECRENGLRLWSIVVTEKAIFHRQKDHLLDCCFLCFRRSRWQARPGQWLDRKHSYRKNMWNWNLEFL